MPKFQATAPDFAGFRQLPGGGFSFTMVPNQFLDEIVPFEKPCVVKVVCLVLRRTLGWIDQTGQRRQQDQVAYSEFAREMNMSTQAVADGLKIALDKGYIVRVKAGTMRDAASGNPEAACYSLRWLSPLQPAAAPEPAKSETSNTVDSEKQTASPSLILRDMINKADSEKINHVELKPSSKICKKRGKFSDYIGNLISEIGEQFGDDDHRLSNIKQALNCWEKSKLDEKEFAQLIYQARTLTRQHTSAVSSPVQPAKSQPDRSVGSWVTLAGTPAKDELPRPDKSSPVSPRNRMPYFFRVLQDLVDRPERKTISQKILPQNQALEKQNLTLHKPKRVKALPAERVEAQPVSTVAAAESTVAVETLFSRNDTPPELARIAERFASDSDLVLDGWQRWQSSLNDSKLKALARRILPVERSHVRPELQTLLFPPGANGSLPSNIRKDFLLVFRNAFDARYAGSYIAEITRSLENFGKETLQVYITYN